MTTIYQVVTTSGIVKGTFVFLDDAQEFIKNKRTALSYNSVDSGNNKNNKREER